MLNIEDYRKPDGEVDYDKYNADWIKQKATQHETAIETLEEAQELARLNGFDLQQHSPWHFSLTCLTDGKRQWRINLYPSNQRMWADLHCGKVPFLKVPSPWTFLDVVSAAIVQQHPSPKQLYHKYHQLINMFGEPNRD